jgi:glucarate dehydratase
MFVTSFEEVAPAVEMDAVDVILSDYHYWEGLVGGMHLDTVAWTLDLGIAVHSTPHLGVGLAAMTHAAAAMPTIRYASDTHYPWMTEDVIESPFEISDGTVAVSDDPGLGVTLDDRKVSRLNEQYERTEPLAFSGISSLGAKLDGDSDEVVPNKPRW